jgi:hypothetical protein
VPAIGGPQRAVKLRKRVECRKQHVPFTLQVAAWAGDPGSLSFSSKLTYNWTYKFHGNGDRTGSPG